MDSNVRATHSHLWDKAWAIGALALLHLGRDRPLPSTAPVMAAGPLRIQQLTADEVAKLRQALKSRAAGTGDAQGAFYKTPLELVQSTLLVAWSGDTPLGIAVIAWDGPRNARARKLYRDCVEIHTLQVDAIHRRRGTGSHLLAACEGAAVERGIFCTGISVALSNVDAYSLFLRHGYTEMQRLEFDAAGPADAPTRSRFLVKSLLGPDTLRGLPT